LPHGIIFEALNSKGEIMKTKNAIKYLLGVASILLLTQTSWSAIVTKSLNVSQCYSDYVQTIQQLNTLQDMCPSLSKQVRHGLYKDYSMSCYNMGKIVAQLSFDNSDGNCVRAFNSLPTAQFEITQPNPDAQNGSSYTFKFSFDRRESDGKNNHLRMVKTETFVDVLTLIQGDFENNIEKCKSFVERNEKKIPQEINTENRHVYNLFFVERLAPDSITKMNERLRLTTSLMEACSEAATAKKVW
jgi:hypothetical protein